MAAKVAKVVKDVIVISDSEDDSCSIITSPLTALKTRPVKPASVKRPVKRLTKQPKNQTKLDNFFHTLTIKSKKTSALEDHAFSSTVDSRVETFNGASKSMLNSSEAFPEVSKSTKRPATKGISPLAKLPAKEKPKITELKGLFPFVQ